MSVERVINFASETYTGAHPLVRQYIACEPDYPLIPYGEDPYVVETQTRLACLFGNPKAHVFYVNGGTAANIFALWAYVGEGRSVILADTSHIVNNEGTALAHVAGMSAIQIPSFDGKITPTDIMSRIGPIDDHHRGVVGAVSITQPTELGVCYTKAEIQAIARICRKNKLLLHMDGARIANAAVSLGLSLAETVKGVDLLSFGFTKNGALNADGVIVLNNRLCTPEKRFHALSIQKEYGQLPAKQPRSTSAQLLAMMCDNLWETCAQNANTMASVLAQGLLGLPHVRITQEVQTNGVWVAVKPELKRFLEERFHFYVWAILGANEEELRLMTTWQTKQEEVEALLKAIRDFSDQSNE